MPADDVAWALRETAAKAEEYLLHRDYYEGKHRLLFATERFRSTFANTFKAFADNLSAPVVDALADRLQLEGYEGPDAQETEALFGGPVRFKRLGGELILEALRCADSYAIGELSPMGDVVAWPQDPSTMAVEYDELIPGRIKRAAKVWRTAARRWRVTVYLPDLTERWTTHAASDTRPDSARVFMPYEDDAAGPEIPNKLGRPPVVHFANNAPIGGFGRSELVDVIPLQDALNKAIADMLVGSEFVAMPQRYGIGVEEKRDPDTGRRLPMFRSGADRFWHTSNPNAKFGQFDGADLSKFLEVQDSFRTEIARVSGTPLHYFQLGNAITVPSGVAVERLEGRLVRKAEDRQLTLGESFVELGNLMRELASRPPAPDLMPRWAEAANRDEAAEIEVAAAKVALGVPLEVALIELGYSPADAKKWAGQKQVNAEAAAAAALASFDRGNVPVTMDQGAAMSADDLKSRPSPPPASTPSPTWGSSP